MTIPLKMNEKEDNYRQLLLDHTFLYPDFEFMLITIIIEALGTVTKRLCDNL